MFSVAKAGKDSTRLCLRGAGTGGTAVFDGVEVEVTGCGGTCWVSLGVVRRWGQVVAPVPYFATTCMGAPERDPLPLAGVLGAAGNVGARSWTLLAQWVDDGADVLVGAF